MAALACTRASRPTSPGRVLCEPTSKKTVAQPFSSTTAYNWPSVSASSHQATGTEAKSTARARSDAIRTLR